jgi:hypothetical protein
MLPKQRSGSAPRIQNRLSSMQVQDDVMVIPVMHDHASIRRADADHDADADDARGTAAFALNEREQQDKAQTG